MKNKLKWIAVLCAVALIVALSLGSSSIEFALAIDKPFSSEGLVGVGLRATGSCLGFLAAFKLYRRYKAEAESVVDWEIKTGKRDAGGNLKGAEQDEVDND